MAASAAFPFVAASLSIVIALHVDMIDLIFLVEIR